MDQKVKLLEPDFTFAVRVPTWTTDQGVISEHRDRPYRGGRQKHWLKVKNRKHPAISRGMESFS